MIDRIQAVLRTWGMPVLALTGILYLVLVVSGRIPAEQRLGQTELILIAVMLLFASGVLRGLAEMGLSKDGLQLRWKEQIEKEQQKQRQDIESIQFLIAHLVTSFEVGHLTRLAGNEPFSYHRHATFDMELRHLRDLGFVEPVPGQPPSVAALPREGGDLRARFRLTERGYQYLRLRSERSVDGSANLPSG